MSSNFIGRSVCILVKDRTKPQFRELNTAYIQMVYLLASINFLLEKVIEESGMKTNLLAYKQFNAYVESIKKEVIHPIAWIYKIQVCMGHSYIRDEQVTKAIDSVRDAINVLSTIKENVEARLTKEQAI